MKHYETTFAHPANHKIQAEDNGQYDFFFNLSKTFSR